MGEKLGSDSKGFQILKRLGWKEGTGLGISGQGRSEPLEIPKTRKRCLGLAAADIAEEEVVNPNHEQVVLVHEEEVVNPNHEQERLSKRARKMQKLEKKMEEKEIERAFKKDADKEF